MRRDPRVADTTKPEEIDLITRPKTVWHLITLILTAFPKGRIAITRLIYRMEQAVGLAARSSKLQSLIVREHSQALPPQPEQNYDVKVRSQSR